jgi:AsmA family/AsmA-like C-terminal region
MNRVRKYGKIAALFVVLLIVAQVGVSFVMRTHRVREYLVAHLARAFGRPVTVGRFSAQFLPIPLLDVDAITVAEDPAFGNEYFLRAERMTASLRWWGLLKGEFEFGTMALTRPSLILVRNSQGKWNLEGWLPPAPWKAVGNYVTYGPQVQAESTQHLRKIEFDDGRINFKFGDEKRPFAFTNVSGSVEQLGAGRWQVRMEAVPWRSGVQLQSTGTLQVSGDVAGTLARLQPAEVRLHWGKVSLADLFRLMTGNDYGVRGQFALDGTASIGKTGAVERADDGKWQFALQARATQLHRWDLTERSDNPAINVDAKGKWDLAAGQGGADEVKIDLPHSNLQGSGLLRVSENRFFSAHITSAAVQAEDLLAWYRAFQPGMAEDLSIDDLLTGNGTISGWPVKLEEARLAATNGVLRVPGIAQPVRIGEIRGELRNRIFAIEPVRLSLSTPKVDQIAKAPLEKAGTKMRAAAEALDTAEIQAWHDFAAQGGKLRVEGRLEKSENLFKLASAFGKTLNHGWELTGPVTGTAGLEWDRGLLRNVRRSAAISAAKAELQVAGLNLPIRLDDARFEWNKGQRNATVAKAGAFGAIWTGTISATAAAGEGELPRWKFQLHADRLDAAELDRWVGPRARPNWLQRLLSSLLGSANTLAKASELLRRVSAEGDLFAETIVIEKISLSKAHANLALQDLHLNVRSAEAQWAGGAVNGSLQAVFGAAPKYEISADVEQVNLGQLPWTPRWAERWSGTASGKIQLRTAGVGRVDLLQQIEGNGQITARNVEFRGWDVAGSLDAGTLRTGSSRWTSAEGEFAVKDRVVSLDAIRLNGSRGKTVLKGTIDFAQAANLTFSEAAMDKRAAASVIPGRRLELTGPLEAPQVTIKAVSAEQAKR